MMNFSAKSVAGIKKAGNDDSFLIKKTGQGAVLAAVADGLGGQPAGDVASRTAIRHVEFFNLSDPDTEKALASMIIDADAAVAKLSDDIPDYHYMGTTLTLVLVEKNQVFWAHVGDTRIYHLRKDRLDVITTDQTMAQFLVEEGDITEEESMTHPMRGLLDQSLGCGFCEPETGRFDLVPGDIIFLCSDGFYSFVPPDRIRQILEKNLDVEGKTERLIQAAVDSGSDDDITVVILQN